MSDERERHDRLFRETFENVQHAAVELKAFLPKSISARIDWSSLKVESGALRGKGKRLECDMLYSAKLDGKRVFIYLLFEHQSSVDVFMSLRMAGYVIGIYDRIRDQPGRQLPLPLILPLVIHHSETGWTAATDLHSLFDPQLLGIEGVRELVPQFRFLLDDISHLSDEELLARASSPSERLVSMTLWALRDGRNGERLRSGFNHWIEWVAEAWEQENRPELFEKVFWYISLADDGLSRQDLLRAAENAASNAKEALMTLAEELRQEGRQEGRYEGRHEGRTEALAKQIQLKFGPLSTATEQKLQTASVEDLDRWSEQVLTATTLEEVLR